MDTTTDIWVLPVFSLKSSTKQSAIVAICIFAASVILVLSPSVFSAFSSP